MYGKRIYSLVYSSPCLCTCQLGKMSQFGSLDCHVLICCLRAHYREHLQSSKFSLCSPKRSGLLGKLCSRFKSPSSKERRHQARLDQAAAIAAYRETYGTACLPCLDCNCLHPA